MADEVIAGRYRLLEPLGRGAMSSVWLAQDEELERRVAVKMLAQNADRARFEREARSAAALSHPNICSLYDYGEADGRPYMVLEYLPNGSLEERLKAGALADDETLRIATEMAAGLAHAHDRGLVHRDLKPANVLFDSEDRAKIADFGIARMGGSGTLTEAGTVLGTASYISPEQASGQPAGPASDVYSFGVILFRMLTGRLPFSSKNAMELVRMHRDDPPPSVAEFRDDAPARLESVTAAALAKDPLERPADGGALLRELRGAGGDATVMLAPGAFPPVAADATQVIRPARPPQRRKREYWLLPLVLLLLAGGIALALLTTSGGGSTETTTNSLTGLSLPTVATAGSTKPTTTAATSTTAPATTTAPTTTAAHTTTHRVTTAPVTTPTTPTVVPSTTVAAPPTTTAPPPPPPTTTVPATTTDTTPTTTAATTTGP
jgi:eukaryotic-like serine/threonine-protein kinase